MSRSASGDAASLDPAADAAAGAVTLPPASTAAISAVIANAPPAIAATARRTVAIAAEPSRSPSASAPSPNLLIASIPADSEVTFAPSRHLLDVAPHSRFLPLAATGGARPRWLPGPGGAPRARPRGLPGIFAKQIDPPATVQGPVDLQAH